MKAKVDRFGTLIAMPETTKEVETLQDWFAAFSRRFSACADVGDARHGYRSMYDGNVGIGALPKRWWRKAEATEARRRPRLRRVSGRWYCAESSAFLPDRPNAVIPCEVRIGAGRTPHEAYSSWLPSEPAVYRHWRSL